MRQHRYDGFKRWKVPLFVGLLPVILRISFVLFGSGLAIWLYNFDHTAAISFVAVGGTWVLLSLMAAISPLFSDNCPYRSPESLLILNIGLFVYRVFLRLYDPLTSPELWKAVSWRMRDRYATIGKKFRRGDEKATVSHEKPLSKWVALKQRSQEKWAMLKQRCQDRWTELKLKIWKEGSDGDLAFVVMQALDLAIALILALPLSKNTSESGSGRTSGLMGDPEQDPGMHLDPGTAIRTQAHDLARTIYNIYLEVPDSEGTSSDTENNAPATGGTVPDTSEVTPIARAPQAMAPRLWDANGKACALILCIEKRACVERKEGRWARHWAKLKKWNERHWRKWRSPVDRPGDDIKLAHELSRAIQQAIDIVNRPDRIPETRWAELSNWSEAKWWRGLKEWGGVEGKKLKEWITPGKTKRSKKTELGIQALVAASSDLGLSGSSLTSDIVRCAQRFSATEALQIVHRIGFIRMRRRTTLARSEVGQNDWVKLWDYWGVSDSPATIKAIHKLTRRGSKALLKIASDAVARAKFDAVGPDALKSAADMDAIQSISKPAAYCIATLLLGGGLRVDINLRKNVAKAILRLLSEQPAHPECTPQETALPAFIAAVRLCFDAGDIFEGLELDGVLSEGKLNFTPSFQTSAYTP